MKSKQVTVVSAAIVFFAATGLSFAQSSTPESGAGKSDHGMMGEHGMMGGDTKGMMGMMHGCSRMMGSSSGAGAMMPHLPPGNEKLELRMRGEMMQKMGEIILKYADRINAPASGSR